MKVNLRANEMNVLVFFFFGELNCMDIFTLQDVALHLFPELTDFITKYQC